ncbi:MAG: helix-turn-helix domain-containing protein [Lachnospiraceae bacterium]|nr:helix-turn-helix domain-containing protein [Lachnospiraceae bacterium]
MEIVDEGVLSGSYMDFTSPSEFARQALYTLPQYGHFICDSKYHIARQPLDWLLMIYINSGELSLRCGTRHFTGSDGQLILLDCRKAHEYRCLKQTDFYWFHFCGNSSEAYADLLYEQGSFLLSNDQSARHIVEAILAEAPRMPFDEHRISGNIQRLLIHMAAPAEKTVDYKPLAPALSYIRNHFGDSIMLDELAELCGMSTSHFIRSFQKHIGRTPHEYLLAYRLREAKQLLIFSNDTIECIAETCGFNSASHFARSFRANNNMRPSEFRKMQF